MTAITLQSLGKKLNCGDPHNVGCGENALKRGNLNTPNFLNLKYIFLNIK